MERRRGLDDMEKDGFVDEFWTRDATQGICFNDRRSNREMIVVDFSGDL
jgi:hypothetical protein